MSNPAAVQTARRGPMRTKRPGLAVLAGITAAFGHAPFDLWLLSFIGFAVLLRLAAAAPTAGAGARCLWAGAAAYFAVSLNWLVEPFLVDAAVTGWLAPVALAAMSGGLALFWGGAAWLAISFMAAASLRARIAALVGLIVLAEMARAVVLTGFPWAHPGHVLIGGPLLAMAGLAGAHGLTLIVLGVAGVMAVLGPRRPVTALAVLAAPLVGAIWLSAGVAPAPAPAADAPIIRLVQPNAAQHLKWRDDMIPVFFQRALNLTAQPGMSPPDLVIWPETSLPVLLEDSRAARARIVVAGGGAQIIVGAQRFQGFQPRNSLAVIDASGGIADVYDKHRLVPFGEYIPGGAAAYALGLRGLAERLDGGYGPGPGPRVMALGAGLGDVFPMICYEAIFARDLQRTARPDWMLQITNDAWFGAFSGPYQHLALARLRAAEQGLPLLRSANTGVSAVIDARGRIVAMLPLNVPGALDAPLPVALPPTLYARSGDIPILFFVLLATVAVLLRYGKRRPLRPAA